MKYVAPVTYLQNWYSIPTCSRERKVLGLEERPCSVEELHCTQKTPICARPLILLLFVKGDSTNDTSTEHSWVFFPQSSDCLSLSISYTTFIQSLMIGDAFIVFFLHNSCNFDIMVAIISVLFICMFRRVVALFAGETMMCEKMQCRHIIVQCTG